MSAWYWRAFWNFEGLTHQSPPFLFGLTLCGLSVVRTVDYRQNRRTAYTLCRRCFA